jgi:hypothetical protein
VGREAYIEPDLREPTTHESVHPRTSPTPPPLSFGSLQSQNLPIVCMSQNAENCNELCEFAMRIEKRKNGYM